MFILDEKTADLSEVPSFCHLKGIVSDQLLYLPVKGKIIEKEEYAIGLWMVGVDSRAFKKAVGMNQQKAAKAAKINVGKLSGQEMLDLLLVGERSNADIVVAVTTGWQNFTTKKSGVIEFTKPALKEFFIANPGYKEQGADHYTSRANQLGNA